MSGADDGPAPPKIDPEKSSSDNPSTDWSKLALPADKPRPVDRLQAGELVIRLCDIAAGYGGKFVVCDVGSDEPAAPRKEPDPKNGGIKWVRPDKPADVRHIANDENAGNGLLAAIELVNSRRGANTYICIALMKSELAAGSKGKKADVLGVLAAVTDWDAKNDPETRTDRLPLPVHIEVETSPGNFQCWYLFDRPYPADEAEPVLTALAKCTESDSTHNTDRVMRVPGTWNWPGLKKIIDYGRDPEPFPARVTFAAGDLWLEQTRVSLDVLRAAILAKCPNAFDGRENTGTTSAKFDWDTSLRPGNARELRDRTIKKKLETEGDRSAIAYGVIRELAQRRYTPAQVREKLTELYEARGGGALAHYAENPKGFDAALDADIVRAFTKPFDPEPDHAGVFNAYLDPAKPPAPPRRDIKIIGGALPTTLDDAERALIEQGVDLFQRGDMVVRPGREPAIRIRDDRTVAGMRLFEVLAVEMREHMTATAKFLRWDARSGDYKRIDCPEAVAAGYLARKGRRNLRALTAVIDAPTMRLDGTLLDQPGYDKASGLYLIPGITSPLIPAEPTRAEASDALKVLKDLVRGFPFVTNADRSAWLSATLTAPIRSALPTAPLFIFNAPAAGSGKGKLVDTAATIATGRPASAFNQGRSEEETEKRLGSILLTGDLCINMDNCTLPIGGDFLCSVLTAPDAVRVRILGRSEAPKLPVVATMFATGNNSTVRGDMTRRALRCTIDPEVERPETREFDFDPVELAQGERGSYLSAVLTIMRAHAVAQHPQPKMPPFGSFEVWSRTVRAALVWLGEADPCDTMKDLAADDEERETLAMLIEAWHAAHGTEALSVAAAAAKLSTEMLRKVAPSLRGDGYDARRLGWYLRSHARKVVNERRLVQIKSGNNSLWRIEVVH